MPNTHVISFLAFHSIPRAHWKKHKPQCKIAKKTVPKLPSPSPSGRSSSTATDLGGLFSLQGGKVCDPTRGVMPFSIQNCITFLAAIFLEDPKVPKSWIKQMSGPSLPPLASLKKMVRKHVLPFALMVLDPKSKANKSKAKKSPSDNMFSEGTLLALAMLVPLLVFFFCTGEWCVCSRLIWGVHSRVGRRSRSKEPAVQPERRPGTC